MGWRYAKSLVTEFLPEAAMDYSDLWDSKEEREMFARVYVLPELQPILLEAKVRWKYINYGYLFKFAGSYKLGWWPRTGSIAWQGYVQGEEYFLPKDRSVVARVQAFLAIPTVGELYPDEFPERKRSRRKPSKGEMLRHVEERRNERDRLSAGSPGTNPQLDLYTEAEMRVPRCSGDIGYGVGDQGLQKSVGKESDPEEDSDDC
jgi:hypothetical protein